MSGHGNWSGQGERKRRDGGSDGANVGIGVGAESFNNGELDSEYDGMTMRRAVRHLNEKYESEYGSVKIPTSSKYITGEVGIDIVKATDGIMQDFAPLFNDGLHIVSSRERNGNWLARAGVGEVLYGRKDGKVEFNNSFLDTVDHSNASYERFSSTERGGFHFPNNTPGATAAHELGHVIDARLTRIQHGSSAWSSFDSWNKGDVAGDIIHTAARSIGLSSGSSWTEDGIKSLGKTHISGYAGHDIHETFAEAFGDVFANGSNASALSKAIYNETRRRVSLL